uniref:hypothetical protein n=1 Tax=Ningiella ruwaisensis TaxID=2364274 RepID=UPI00109EE7B0|nr:hypothetical protein [Ningiella ruwaisensis]
MSKSMFLKLAGGMLFLCMLLYVWIANEARKEVYFLCGNFVAGTRLDDVQRQLNTINISRYEQFKDAKTGQISLIHHSSALNFHLFVCEIKFDDNKQASSVNYRSIF